VYFLYHLNRLFNTCLQAQVYTNVHIYSFTVFNLTVVFYKLKFQESIWVLLLIQACIATPFFLGGISLTRACLHFIAFIFVANLQLDWFFVLYVKVIGCRLKTDISLTATAAFRHLLCEVDSSYKNIFWKLCFLSHFRPRCF